MITLTNLIANPNITSTGWAFNGTSVVEDSTRSYKWNKCAKLIGGTSYPEVTLPTTTTMPLDPTHIYYASFFIYFENQPFANQAWEIFFPIVAPDFAYGYFSSLSPNKWNRVSMVNHRNGFTQTSGQLRLDMDNIYQTGEVWYDGMMLIDLTASFGAGNEPTKEQMDNIPFFETMHTISEKVFVGINNVAKEVKNIYFGDNWRKVTLTNLIQNGDLSNGTTGWTFSYQTRSSNGEFQHQANTTSMANQSMPTPEGNHKYYGRVMQKAPAGMTVSDNRFEWYLSDTASGMMVFGRMTATNDVWTASSAIVSISAPTAGSWKIRSFTVNASAICYRDEMIIVDLTAAFGAGNEPDKAWCDANIPYFDGSKTILLPTDGPVAHEASKIYVGVNGVAKLVWQNLPFPIGTVFDFPYTGSVQPMVLPKGKYKLEVWGAQGGSYSSYYGGTGGYSVGTLNLQEQTNTFVYVGGQPATSTNSKSAVTGGFNGGGNGSNISYSSVYTYGQGGGGATDIRIGEDNLYARVIVAGGGGGSASANAKTTKYGGGLSSGSPYSSYVATQTKAGSGGSFGQGGSSNQAYFTYKYGAGGGGGGWYGGGSTTGQSDDSGVYRGYNGGGSGYVYDETNAKNYPGTCLLSSKYYLKDASTTAGNVSMPSVSGGSETGHEGHGYARITYLGKPDKV